MRDVSNVSVEKYSQTMYIVKCNKGFVHELKCDITITSADRPSSCTPRQCCIKEIVLFII